jgi:oligopeptide/dipeptide ABC transporter ATP-binding protein
VTGEPTGSADGASLLELRGLTVEFAGGRGRPPLRALDGVDLTIGTNETVGLVGESGSGKSTLGGAVLGLVPATSGSVEFAGEDITRAGPRERRRLSAELQVVFQDPYGSLNPTRTIGQTLAEMLRVHKRLGASEVADRVATMLERVGLPADAARRYPGNFSGGQRQRIAIGRALMVRPRLVICDEAVSALDLSVQAQVLNLLRELQAELGLSYLFIAHDLAIVRHVSHRIVVLYRGRVVEEGPAASVYDRPRHPYTRALLDAAPKPDPVAQRRRRAGRARRAPEAGGEVEAETACRFASRCPHAIDICRSRRPALEATADGSLVACHRWRELGGGPAPAAATADPTT